MLVFWLPTHFSLTLLNHAAATLDSIFECLQPLPHLFQILLGVLVLLHGVVDGGDLGGAGLGQDQGGLAGGAGGSGALYLEIREEQSIISKREDKNTILPATTTALNCSHTTWRYTT